MLRFLTVLVQRNLVTERSRSCGRDTQCVRQREWPTHAPIRTRARTHSA